MVVCRKSTFPVLRYQMGHRLNLICLAGVFHRPKLKIIHRKIVYLIDFIGSDERIRTSGLRITKAARNCCRINLIRAGLWKRKE